MSHQTREIFDRPIIEGHVHAGTPRRLFCEHMPRPRVQLGERYYQRWTGSVARLPVKAERGARRAPGFAWSKRLHSAEVRGPVA